MTVTSLTEFLGNGQCGTRESWSKDRWICLDKETGTCLLKKVENGMVSVSEHKWPIEDLAADDWTIVFIKEEED